MATEATQDPSSAAAAQSDAAAAGDGDGERSSSEMSKTDRVMLQMIILKEEVMFYPEDSPFLSVEDVAIETLVDPRDDLEKAVAWIWKARVDSKGLAKRLPHTADALRRGDIDLKVLANSLGLFAYEHHHPLLSPQQTRQSSATGTTAHVTGAAAGATTVVFSTGEEFASDVEYALYLLAKRAIPTEWFLPGISSTGSGADATATAVDAPSLLPCWQELKVAAATTATATTRRKESRKIALRNRIDKGAGLLLSSAFCVRVLYWIGQSSAASTTMNALISSFCPKSRRKVNAIC